MDLGARHDWEVEMNSSILSLISRYYIIRRALQCKSTRHQDPSIKTACTQHILLTLKHENEWYLERRKSLHHATLEWPATRRSCHDTHVLALTLLWSLLLLFADDTQKYLV
jgi:hypothetical protein